MKDKIIPPEEKDDEKGGEGSKEVKKELFIIKNEKASALLNSQLVLQGYNKGNPSLTKKISEGLDHILAKIYLLRSKQLKVIFSALLKTGIISNETNKTELKKLLQVITQHLSEFAFMNKTIKEEALEKRIEAKTIAIIKDHNNAVSKEKLSESKTINLEKITPRMKR